MTLSLGEHSDAPFCVPLVSGSASPESLDVEINLQSFGLARRENVEMRDRSMQGPTRRLPKHIEPKDPKILRDRVLKRTLLHIGRSSSSDISHHFPIILATVV